MLPVTVVPEFTNETVGVSVSLSLVVSAPPVRLMLEVTVVVPDPEDSVSVPPDTERFSILAVPDVEPKERVPALTVRVPLTVQFPVAARVNERPLVFTVKS